MERIEQIRSHFSHEVEGDRISPEPTAFGTPPSMRVELRESYDFVIVGGGSAGCVVAARLSEDPNVSVLLLEAGGEHNTFAVSVPSLYSLLQLSEVDWQLKTEPQAALNNRVGNWPRGKVLGGCSAINAMLYLRGSASIYDRWAQQGCEGWEYKSVLPYFKKSERCVVEGVDREYHGTDGPLTVSPPQRGNPNIYSKLFVKACDQAGIPQTNDHNGKRSVGASLAQTTVVDGVRCSTAKAFLDPIREKRKNLTIATGVHVTKVLFQGNTAIGVTFKRGSVDVKVLQGKKTEFVGARKEVILCAGAVHTPWLLQLSGVGPAEELEKHKIPIVADLPVGKNLQDHMFSFLSFEAKDQLALKSVVNPGIQELLQVAQHALLKSGPMSCSILEAHALTTTSLSDDPNGDTPDLQIHFVPVAPNVKTALQMAKNQGMWSNIDKHMPLYGVSFLPTLLLPRSVGYVGLRSSNPLDNPLIEPNYLSDKDGNDRKVLIEGLKISRKIASQDALKSKLKEIIDPTIPFPPESEEYLSDYVTKSAVTVYHPVGTCKMGPVNDPTTVVCPRLKIKGLKGIRVVDCSICPSIPNANTNAPAIMIGERASDFIKEEHKLRMK